MSLQIECSVEKGVTIRTTKRLENCNNVVHIAYKVFVSQQSHSIFVFLYTSSTKFTHFVPIHNINIIQQNVESSQIFNRRNTVHMDYLELIGAQSIHFIDEKLE